MEWYSWTSPLGLGIFILCASSALYIVSGSIYTLSRAGVKGMEIENKKK